MTTLVGSTLVQLALPAGENVAHLVLAPPTGPVPVTPTSPQLQPIPGAAVVVTASDAAGQVVTTLNAPVTLSLTFHSLLGINTELAQIYTLDADGNAQALATLVDDLGHGSYQVTAQTSHFSPFVVYAPGMSTPVPQVYLPAVRNSVSSGQ